MSNINDILTRSVKQEEFDIFRTTIIEYNGLHQNSLSENKAGLSSMNGNQFDILRCRLQSEGVDKFGSQFIAKEMLKLVKDKKFTFSEVLYLTRSHAITAGSNKFAQRYLEALNAYRSSSSRLDLISANLTPNHIAREIVI